MFKHPSNILKPRTTAKARSSSTVREETIATSQSSSTVIQANVVQSQPLYIVKPQTVVTVQPLSSVSQQIPDSQKATPPVLMQVIRDEVGRLYIAFNPKDHGLPADFSLTQYGNNSEITVKPNHNDLQALLSSFLEINHEQDPDQYYPPTILSEGLTVATFDQSDLILLENTSAIPPMIEDPYKYGYIASMMTMSGLYAEGILWCSTHRIMLTLSTQLSLQERNIVLPLIVQGYIDAATVNNVRIHSIRVAEGPVLLIGGIVTSLVHRQMYLKYQFAVPGDILILTKPLGTTVALKLAKAMQNPQKKSKLLKTFTLLDSEIARGRAIDCMCQSNLKAALLMRQLNAHAACEIGPHGLSGHADILVKQQLMAVNFVINNLPMISRMDTASRLLGCSTNFLRGTQPEISGGLLIAMAKEHAAVFIKEFRDRGDEIAWIIGTVDYGNRQVKISPVPRIVTFPEKPLIQSPQSNEVPISLSKTK